MSQFGQKVVAVIDTQSAFGVTIKTLKENVDTLSTRFNTLTAGAPEVLDTLQEIAAALENDPNFFQTISDDRAVISNALTVEQNNRVTAINALQTLLDAKAALNGATFYWQRVGK